MQCWHDAQHTDWGLDPNVEPCEHGVTPCSHGSTFESNTWKQHVLKRVNTTSNMLKVLLSNVEHVYYLSTLSTYVETCERVAQHFLLSQPMRLFRDLVLFE